MNNRMKIMVVDDNTVNLATIEQELSDRYDIVPMLTGRRAIKYLYRETCDMDRTEALDHNFLDDIQLNSGLDSSLHTKQLLVQLDLDTITIDKVKQFNSLLKELVEKPE